jgi:hypothetical protein
MYAQLALVLHPGLHVDSSGCMSATSDNLSDRLPGLQAVSICFGCMRASTCLFIYLFGRLWSNPFLHLQVLPAGQKSIKSSTYLLACLSVLHTCHIAWLITGDSQTLFK